MDKILEEIIGSHSLANLKEYCEHAPVDLNHKNNKGYNALIYCADRYFTAGVEYLISLPRINLEIKNKNQETALYSAARTGDLPITKLLLEAGAKLETTNYTGRTVFWKC